MNPDDNKSIKSQSLSSPCTIFKGILLYFITYFNGEICDSRENDTIEGENSWPVELEYANFVLKWPH